MGARNWWRQRHMTDPIKATYKVTKRDIPVSAGPAGYAVCHLTGVVNGHGLSARTVTHSCLAPTRRWPTTGQTLPVLVDRADPTRLRILWQQAPTVREREADR